MSSRFCCCHGIWLRPSLLRCSSFIKDDLENGLRSVDIPLKRIPLVQNTFELGPTPKSLPGLGPKYGRSWPPLIPLPLTLRRKARPDLYTKPTQGLAMVGSQIELCGG